MPIIHRTQHATVHAGDCLDVLRELPDESVHAVITDPPYGLSNTTPAQVTDCLREWSTGNTTYTPAKRGGFMGNDWDSFVPPPAVWEECLRVLKPGGHLLAFAGSRTQDLMGMSVRLAGFDIRDNFAWLYGSGFPKSMDVSKAIDKGTGQNKARQHEFTAWMRSTGITSSQINDATGTNMGGHYLTDQSQPAIATADLFDKLRPLLPEVPERIERLVAERTGIEWSDYAKREKVGVYQSGIRAGTSGAGGGGEGGNITTSHTPAAQQWEGWGTALKPAHEPVIRAQKPFSVVPLDGEVNQIHHLLGGLNWLSLSNVKRAELASRLSPAGQQEETCATAHANAAAENPEAQSEKTGTFRSQAAASTSLSIAKSWKTILGALSAQKNTSTTSTKSSMTTGLRTLNSLLGPLTSQTTMPQCECLAGGQSPHAKSATPSSTGDWVNWWHTLRASVPESAIEGIALAAASVLADIAEQFSADEEEASTAHESATTSQGANNEPVIMARKPFKGTCAANVLEHGTGALNIDASRIESDPETFGKGGGSKVGSGGGDKQSPTSYRTNGVVTPMNDKGRFPANVILDESQAAELDEQSGTLKSGQRNPSPSTSTAPFNQAAGLKFNTGTFPADSGGASRFFYIAKAPKSERPNVDGVAHPTVKPLTLMRYLIRMVTPPGGTILDPFAGSGTTLEAATLEGFTSIGIEAHSDYLPLIAHRLDRGEDQEQEQLDFEAAP